MLMQAKKAFRYAGKRVAVGDTFEVASVRDQRTLKAVGHADAFVPPPLQPPPPRTYVRRDITPPERTVLRAEDQPPKIARSRGAAVAAVAPVGGAGDSPAPAPVPQDMDSDS